MRAYLSASSDVEIAEAERQFIMLARTGDADGIGELVYAAFVIAARRAFAPTWESAGIVRFVADVRSSSPEAFGILDPKVAENQLRAALGQEPAGCSDEEARARAQLIPLAALTDRLGLTAQGLDKLLSDGSGLADDLIRTGGKAPYSCQECCQDDQPGNGGVLFCETQILDVLIHSLLWSRCPAVSSTALPIALSTASTANAADSAAATPAPKELSRTHPKTTCPGSPETPMTSWSFKVSTTTSGRWPTGGSSSTGWAHQTGERSRSTTSSGTLPTQNPAVRLPASASSQPGLRRSMAVSDRPQLVRVSGSARMSQLKAFPCR
jgi:hypothetical protein